MISAGFSALSVTLDGTALDVFAYRPSGPIDGLLFVFHGNSRNADDYCRYASEVADRYRMIAIAPLFDETRFPSSSYHRGNIIDGSGRIRPAGEWTTRFVPLLVDWARLQEGEALPYWLWGFSAGGQFLSRVAAFEQPDARRIVLGGPSTYVLPLLGSHPSGEGAPYGLGGVYGSEEEQTKLRAYLSLPLSLYIGGADNDPNDPLLTSTSAAMRQGTDRLDRGIRTLALGKSIAEQNGWFFGWRLVIGPEIGHASGAMLRSRRVLEALGLHEVAPTYRISAIAGDNVLRLRMRGFDGRSGQASAAKTAKAA